MALALCLAGPALAQSPTSGRRGGETAVTGSTAPVQASPGPAFLAPVPGDVLASSLIDLEVKGPTGARIGEIEDVVLDAGSVRGVVIGVGGFRGGNARHVAVEMKALDLQRDANGKLRASLNVSPDDLKAAPTFPYRSGFNDDD